MADYLSALVATSMPKDEQRGASAVEYGLLISGIAALIVIIVFAFGDNIRDSFDDTCKSVASTASCTTVCICGQTQVR